MENKPQIDVPKSTGESRVSRRVALKKISRALAVGALYPILGQAQPTSAGGLPSEITIRQFQIKEIQLSDKERDLLLGELKGFLGAFGFTPAGIDVMRNKGWLKEGQLKARKEIAKDSKTVVLYDPETPNSPVYVVSQGDVMKDGGRGQLRRATFNTGHAGNKKMDAFLADVKSLMKEGVEFEEISRESGDGAEEEEESLVVTSAGNKQQPEGEFIREYSAEVAPKNSLINDPVTKRSLVVEPLDIYLRNEGVLELSEVSIEMPSADNRLI